MAYFRADSVSRSMFFRILNYFHPFDEFLDGFIPLFYFLVIERNAVLVVLHFCDNISFSLSV